ncbi:MAG: toxin-antitoxin system YwqK family antitoxin [Candidatus Aminicenantes bacterium]|nr:toxin-antitoxin system YwqK family antitoxin [Candidatus Aminicenantes bacterium]
MKSKLLILVICFVFIIGCEKGDDEEIFDLKGNKISEFEFKLRRETGTIISYYKNGNKKALMTFKNGDPYLIEEWYENGKIKNKREYTRIYSDWKESTWYENGNKEKETEIKNRVEHGKTTRWYENGQKRSEYDYFEGNYHGQCTWWRENGQMSASEEYKYGEPHGKHITWDKNGKIDRETIFKDGKMISDKYPSTATSK